MLPALAPIITCVSATGHCHYTGKCSSSPQLNVCIPLALATTAACPGPYPLYLKALLRTPLQSLQTQPQCSLSTRQLLILWTQWPEPKRHHNPLDLVPPHTLAPDTCTTRPRVTACSSMPPLTGKSLPLSKVVHKVWKR